MKMLFILLLAACFSDARAADIAGDPRNLLVQVALVRFIPDHTTNLVRPFRSLIQDQLDPKRLRQDGLGFVFEVLRTLGSVDVLHRADRDMILSADSHIKFDAMEERPVVVMGKKDSLPPATKFGLSLEMTSKPMTADRFALSWTGTVRWSPELIDSWTLAPGRFISFLSTAAQAAAPLLAKNGGGTDQQIRAGMDIGMGFARLWQPSQAAEGQVYEMPVIKEIAFQSSRICHDGELLLNSTVSEAGGRTPQAIVLLILPLFTI
jgi:hypothetical protein